MNEIKIIANAAMVFSKPWYNKDYKAKRQAEYHAEMQGSSFGLEREFGSLALKKMKDKRSK